MQLKGKILTIAIVLALGLAGIFLKSSIGEESIRGMLIFTQISTEESNSGNNSVQDWRYPLRSRIVAVNLERPEETFQVLTNSFYSARAPEISFDGKRMFFAAKRKENDPWQIWEMKLNGLHTRQVTSGLNGCTDPAYLPDDRIVFSAFNSNLPYENEREEAVINALYTCNLDGSEVKRITFHPYSDFTPTVLRDGRILFASWQVYPSLGASTLLTVRSDGTGIELFYKNPQGGRQNSRGWETRGGQVVFIDSNMRDSIGGNLVTVSQARPLHSRVVLDAEIDGNFHSAFPLASGKLVVSYRPPGARRHALYEFDPVEGHLGQLIYRDPNYHAIEPVVAVERPRAKWLPSIVNEQKKTGWLFCLNASLSDRLEISRMPSSVRAKGVQVLGTQGVLGEVSLEEDNSFYIEIPADTPLQLQNVDEDGQVVRGPSAWLWVRPNEHRGCIGCHEDRELAPDNQIPLAITKPAVSLLSPSSSLAVGNRALSKEIEK